MILVSDNYIEQLSSNYRAIYSSNCSDFYKQSFRDQGDTLIQKLKSNGYIRKKLPAALVGRPRPRLGRQRENLAGTLLSDMPWNLGGKFQIERKEKKLVFNDFDLMKLEKPFICS
jgi:hypothetical protein